MMEYKEHIKAVFPHRVEVGTLPGAGDSTYIVVGFTLESNDFKACFALTTLEARRLFVELSATLRDLAEKEEW